MLDSLPNSSCNDFTTVPLIILTSTNGIAFFVCLIAAILVCIMKLYNKPTYRLTLYQILAGQALAAAFLGQIFLIKHNEFSAEGEGDYDNACVAFAFLLLYTEWVKLALTVWLTIHIFSLAVIFKNLKRFEPLYVATSLLVPAAIAAVPFTTKTYGLAGSWCWIEDWRNDCDSKILVVGAIEQFALWYGPSMVLLVLSATAMFVMVVVVVCRLHVHRTALEGDANWKALKQLLPLAIYPILFLFFIIVPFINRLYGTFHSVSDKEKYDLSVVHAVSAACWNLATGLVFIVHVAVAGMCSKRSALRFQQDEANSTPGLHASINHEPVTKPTASFVHTWFSLPKPSV